MGCGVKDFVLHGPVPFTIAELLFAGAARVPHTVEQIQFRRSANLESYATFEVRFQHIVPFPIRFYDFLAA